MVKVHNRLLILVLIKLCYYNVSIKTKGHSCGIILS